MKFLHTALPLALLATACLQAPEERPVATDGASIRIFALDSAGDTLQPAVTAPGEPILLVLAVEPAQWRSSVRSISWQSLSGSILGTDIDSIQLVSQSGGLDTIQVTATDSEGHQANSTIILRCNSAPAFSGGVLPSPLVAQPFSPADGTWFRWSAADADANDSLQFLFILQAPNSTRDTLHTSHPFLILSDTLLPNSTYTWWVLASDPYGAKSLSGPHTLLTAEVLP